MFPSIRITLAIVVFAVVSIGSLNALAQNDVADLTTGSKGAAAGVSATMEISVEIPRLEVSEYHRPYVAFWIEDESREASVHLAVWYQLQSNREGAGTKWLPDLRQWWRRGGRSLEMPVDGLSGATRPVGQHDLKIEPSKLSNLKPGTYNLVVEAAREVGGREVVRVPFEWPCKSAQLLTAKGETELGEIALSLKP